MNALPGTATVRFWAGARDAAGCSEATITSGPLEEVLGRLAKHHGARLARIIGVSLILVDGEAQDRTSSRTVTPGSVLEVLPPFAGG